MEKKLLVVSAEGNFKSVILILKTIQLYDDIAAEVIIECGRIFHKDNKCLKISNENLDNLCEVVSICLPFIENIGNALLLSIIQTLFFIVKFFINSENYEYLLRFRKILLLKQVDTSSNPKILSTYTSVCSLIHNIIYKFEKANRNDLLYQEVILLLVEMSAKYVLKINDLSNINSTYFKTTNFLKSSSEFRYRCYCVALELTIKKVQVKNVDEYGDIYCAIVKLLEIFLTTVMVNGEIKSVPNYLKEVFSSYKLKKCTTHHELLNHLCWLFEFITSGVKAAELQTFLESYLKDLNLFYNMRLNKELQSTCTAIATVLQAWIDYCTRSNSLELLSAFNDSSDVTIYDFLRRISFMVAKIDSKCLCSPSCNVETDFYTGVTGYVIMGRLFQASLTPDILELILAGVLKHLKECCDHIYHLKINFCSKWKLCWKKVWTSIYNIAAKLYAQENKNSYNYFMLFFTNCTKLEEISASKASEIVGTEVLSSCLTCLSEIEYQNNQYNSSLIFAALKVLLCFETRNVYKQWMKIKCKIKESSEVDNARVQTLTISSFLRQNEKAIKDFYNNFSCSIDNDLNVKLLSNELEQYNLLWPSKIPMFHTFAKLYKFADITTIVKLLIKVWGTNILTAHEDILDILKKIVVKFEKHDMEQVEKNIYLSNLYLMQYLGETVKVRREITKDINRTIILENRPTAPFSEETPNFENETLDIVSSYSFLQLDNHLKVTDLLNKSLQLLEACVTTEVHPANLTILLECNVHDMIASIVEELRLQCDVIRTISACFLSLHVSQLLDDKLRVLKSIALLLEEPAINSITINKLLEDGEKIEEELNEMDSNDHLESVVMYSISKSIVYLREKKVKLGYMEYEKASNLFTTISKDKVNELVKIKLQFLLIKYLQLPCNFQIEAHKANYLGNLSQVNYDITSLYKFEGSSSPTTTTTMFDVNHALVNTYYWMLLPREVRCYGKPIISLAQQLVIPIRTANLLTLLAQADLQSSRINDCKVKLRGLECILDLKSNQQPNNDDNIDDTLRNDFQKMMLDYSKQSNLNELCTSPMIVTNTFKLPSFINHSTNCLCFYCNSIEYQSLVIMYMCLNAQLQSHTNDLKSAKLYFKGGIKIYEHVVKVIRLVEIKYIDKINYPVNCVQDLLVSTYSILLLHFGNFFLKVGNMQEAEKINTKLSNLLLEKNYENTFLQREIHFQKLSITMSRNIDNVQNLSNALSNVKITVDDCTDANTETIKTPENKRSKIVFPTISSSSQKLTPPKRQLVKIKCNFNNPESCEEEPEKLPQLNLIRTPPMRKKVGLMSETKSERKTTRNKKSEATCSTKKEKSSRMKPPKSSILQDTPEKAVKKSSSQRPVLQEIPVKDINKSEEFSFLVPSSPNAYTPNVKKMSSVLNSKTKLLTDKIKTASLLKTRTAKKKLVLEIENTNKANSAVKSKARKKLELDTANGGLANSSLVNRLKGISKNLMDEMESDDDEKVTKKATTSTRVTRSQRTKSTRD